MYGLDYTSRESRIVPLNFRFVIAIEMLWVIGINRDQRIVRDW